MSINMFVNPHLLFESHGFMARSLMDRIQKPIKIVFLPVKPIKISWNPIKKPSKKPWKIHHWASTFVTKARGVHLVVAVHLRAARGQGSVRRGRQGPRGDIRCNYGWYMMGIYVCMFIYIYIHKGDVCIDILLMSTYSEHLGTYILSTWHIYIYVCIYCIICICIYIYYNMLEQNMLRISQDTGISEFRCVWISHCLGSYTSSFFFGQWLRAWIRINDLRDHIFRWNIWDNDDKPLDAMGYLIFSAGIHILLVLNVGNGWVAGGCWDYH
jgi:hypothetical protein